MDSKSFAAAAYRAEHPSRINRRSRRGFVSQAVRADNPHARDPQAYPSSKPRPEKATRPLLSFEWTDLRRASKPAPPPAAPLPPPIQLPPVAQLPYVAPVANAMPPTPPASAAEEPATPESPRLMPSQRAHLLRPLTLRGSNGRQTYVTYTLGRDERQEP